MGDSKAQESPTPSSLREQITQAIISDPAIRANANYPDGTQLSAVDQILSLVTTYIEAATLDARLRDFETMLNTHTTWSQEACTEWLQETITELLQAQKAVLESPTERSK